MNNGINGLGSIDPRSGVISSPGEMLAKFDSDSRMLTLRPEQFSSVEQYTIYLSDWFRAIGTVEVMDADTDLTQRLNMNNIFKVRFINDPSGTVYNVIAAMNMDNAKQFINTFSTLNMTDVHNVLFAYTIFSQNDTDIAARFSTELISSEEMVNINNSITSILGGITYNIGANNNSFANKLMRELHAKYKPAEEFGSNLSNQFKEAGEQLKDSVVQILGVLGLSKVGDQLFNNGNQPNQSAQPSVNQFGQQPVFVPNPNNTSGQTGDMSGLGAQAPSSMNVNPVATQPFGENPINLDNATKYNGAVQPDVMQTNNPNVVQEKTPETQRTGGVDLGKFSRTIADNLKKKDNVNIEPSVNLDKPATDAETFLTPSSTDIPEQTSFAEDELSDMVIDDTNSSSINPLDGIDSNF